MSARNEALALCDAVERIPLALADGRLVALADAIRDALQRANRVRQELGSAPAEKLELYPPELASAGADVVPEAAP